jgi:hypothetical protein
MLSRLKRELGVTRLDLPQLDTSQLSTEDTAAAVIAFWFDHARM